MFEVTFFGTFLHRVRVCGIVTYFHRIHFSFQCSLLIFSKRYTLNLKDLVQEMTFLLVRISECKGQHVYACNRKEHKADTDDNLVYQARELRLTLCVANPSSPTRRALLHCQLLRSGGLGQFLRLLIIVPV